LADYCSPVGSPSEWRAASDRLHIWLRVRNLFHESILTSFFFVFVLRWRSLQWSCLHNDLLNV
jgi:hypothetical protein